MPRSSGFARKRRLFIVSFLIVTLTGSGVGASDWPMWRQNAQRTAVGSGRMPAELHVRWIRQEAPLKPAFRNSRLQFDRGYEPIVHQGRLYFGSSRNDSVTALDAATGNEAWRFYTDGPVRFAPVADGGRLYVGSDDGHLYCLDAASGKQVWRFRAAPSKRKILGNGRMISVWPVRGGPVVQDGRVYFAAGVWPMEGVFVYALDAKTGNVIWLNDSSAFLYGQHPHDAKAFGGLSPQGYLVINGDELIVPGGAAVPATFDLATGRLKQFQLPKPGRLPGGYFASIHSPDAKAIRRGKVVHDSDVAGQEHEDRKSRGIGDPGVRSRVTVGGREFDFGKGLPGIEGRIHTLLAADGRLFGSTLDGKIFCLGEKPERVGAPGFFSAISWPHSMLWRTRAETVFRHVGALQGHALLLGAATDGLVLEMVERKGLKVLGVDPDAGRVHWLRSQLDKHSGAYGGRVSFLAGDSDLASLPPYFASLLIGGDQSGVELRLDAAEAKALYRLLRPYGGTACLFLTDAEHAKFQRAVASAGLENAAIERVEGMTMLRRAGALPGAVDYTGDWSSPDQLVKAPLGVLWFDDSVANFKRSPQPLVIDGVMMSRPKQWEITDERPYRLHPAVYSDVYTGRVIQEKELQPAHVARYGIPKEDPPQPAQYRPPGFTGNSYAPPKPVVGERTNPLTGAMEPRTFPRSYGCDGGVDYGYMYTMRSGTAAFYDKENESGIINISGPRSGCSNSVIPANGVLNVPYFYEGCTCSYPIPSGLALFSLPPTHEQWTAWGPGATNDIHRIGINLGAPGDRMTPAGVLWLDHPSVGGPSPAVRIETEPANPETFYRHSMWIEAGQGWPWVAASGIHGMESITLRGLRDMSCHVRLYFAEPLDLEPGERVFDVGLQGKSVLEKFDVAREAGGRMKSLVKEFKSVRVNGELKISFTARQGRPLLSGIEVVSAKLQMEAIAALPERRILQLESGSGH